MSGTFDPIRDLIKRHADEDRPWRPAVVEDTSRWSDTGAAVISARFAGQLAQNVAYRDGREPLVGETVWLSKTDAGHAPYVALPLPGATHHGYVYISAQDVSGENGNEWAILRFDAYGYRWTRRSASPVAGTWDRRPLKGIGGFRLFTYGTNDDGTGSEAFYSDDAGLTWASTGLTGVLDIQTHSIRLTGAHGSLAAVADDGAKVYASADWGATWGEDTRYNATGQHFYAASFIGSFFYVAALSTAGVYVPDGFGGTLGPILPTSADGGVLMTLNFSSQRWVQVPGGVMETEVDDVFNAGVSDGGDISGTGFAVPGGPHTAGWLGNATYLCNDGAGGRAYRPDVVGNTTMYEGATHHPDALTAGVRGFVVVVGSGDGVRPGDWPPTTGDDGGFRFAAVDDDDPADPRFLIEIGNAFATNFTGTDPWQVADARHLADLGAKYAASLQGTATLEVWDDNYAAF